MALELNSEQVIQKALNMFKAKRVLYQKYDRYMDGNQDLRFATEKFNGAFGNLFRQFSSNMCPLVVEAAADRLQISGFTAPEIQTVDAEGSIVSKPADTTAVDDLWRRNRMDRKAGDIHEEAIKMADSYVIVWPDETGYPIIHTQEAMSVVVCKNENNPDILDWAAKMWLTDVKQWRMDLYFPDRVEKYRTISVIQQGIPDKASAFSIYFELGESWPIANAYNLVPVFHFANKSGMKLYGRSELHDVIPLQDGLNKATMDMIVAMEYSAYPQRWATGLELEIDTQEGSVTEGRVKAPFKAALDRLWTSESAETKFGDFSVASLEQYTAAQESFRLDIARVSRTPLHYFLEGEIGNISGEALKTAEAPFVAKIRDKQIAFGNVWEDVIAYCLLILNQQIDNLELIWESASPRSETEILGNALLKIQAGVPEETVWKEIGYTDEQIASMREIKTAQADVVNQQFMQQFAQA